MLPFYEFETIDETTGLKLKKDILLTMVCELSEAIVTDDIDITEDSKFYVSSNRCCVGLIDGTYHIVCKPKNSVRGILKKVLKEVNLNVDFYQESNEPLNKSDDTNNDNTDRW